MAEPKAAPSTSLTAFENSVFGGEFEVAKGVLLIMLDAIEHGADLPQGISNDTESCAYFTRFAAAIATLLTVDPTPLSPQFVDRLAFHNRHIATVFRLSGYADPGALYKLVRDTRKESRDEATIARILAAATIAAPADVNWRELLPNLSVASSSAFLAQFSHRTPLTEEAERLRNELLKFAPLLAKHELRESQLPLLCQAWMFCSYLTDPSRHVLKRYLNGLVTGMLERSGISAESVPQMPTTAERPKLVVVADVMMSWHAMFKTYANFLKQLRGRFQLTLVCLEGRVDDAVRPIFNEIHEIVDSPNTLRDVVAEVLRISPSILYFPSVGMSVLTVQLCNLRLAPMQVASVGHPATTHSPEIDYIVMGHAYYSDAAEFSERVLLLQSTGALFEPTVGSEPPEPNIRQSPEILRVAVSSSALKLNAAFLSTCRDIASSARRPVEFHLFPNEKGIRHRDCARQIQRFLPDAIVHERTDYDGYLSLLNLCDIRLGSFPFGGANTTMDAYLLGIPTVTLAGAEPHSLTDARFVKLFDLPNWLVADDEHDYREAAGQLIDNDAKRVALSRYILNADPAKSLFDKEQVAFPADFADTLWWAHTNHEAIQKTERRVWRYQDRVEFGKNNG
jgi:hypothetical protein